VVGVSVKTKAWLVRAFEEAWDSVRAPEASSDAELARLRERLCDVWIGGQIRYHAGTRDRHERGRRRLSRFLYLAFGLTLAAALFDTLTAALGGSHSMLSVAQALCIFLPVAGASVGALLTIRQHDALAVRSERMQADLEVVREDLLAAQTVEALRAAVLAAARVVAPESGTWFGAMWFLDVEHP